MRGLGRFVLDYRLCRSGKPILPAFRRCWRRPRGCLGTQVEVLKGLASLDRIVNSPPDSLANGDTVRAAGEFSGSNENLGRAGGETAAASEPKEH